MKLNCIITDDEPIATEILEDYIQLIPELQLVSKCNDAIETFSELHRHITDLLFIDIQLPEISGLDLVLALKKPPYIIFTTAFPQYAVEGFNLDAVDYLLKPISFERFKKAIDKVMQRHHVTLALAGQRKETYLQPAETGNPHLFVKTGMGLIKIDLCKILYIESLENYVKIISDNKNNISLNTMKNMETQLAPNGFVRVHRSFIINMARVDSYADNCFCIGDQKIPVGKSYRKMVAELVKKRFG